MNGSKFHTEPWWATASTWLTTAAGSCQRWLASRPTYGDHVAGWAWRRVWPDGAHDMVGWHASQDQTSAWQVHDRAYWTRSHIRPVYQLTPIRFGRFQAHRGNGFCVSQQCGGLDGPIVDPLTAAPDTTVRVTATPTSMPAPSTGRRDKSL